MARSNNTITLIAASALILSSAIALLPARAACGDVPSDPLEQMVIAFKGSYSKVQIKERLDKAMELYGVPKTRENYSRAASALVTLRKDSGHSEMEILSYMIRSHVPGVNINFPAAAGMAATFLSLGDR